MNESNKYINRIYEIKQEFQKKRSNLELRLSNSIKCYEKFNDESSLEWIIEDCNKIIALNQAESECIKKIINLIQE